MGQKYEESIAEKTKLKRQRSAEIANKEKTINLKLFKISLFIKVQAKCIIL